MLHCEKLTFSDPYEHQQAILDSNVEFLPTQLGSYRSELTRISLHRIQLQRGNMPLAHVSHSVCAPNVTAIYYLTDWQQAPHHHTGQEILPGDIIFYAPGSEHYRHTTSETRWGAISLRTEELAAMGQAVAGQDVTAPPSNRLIRPAPATISRLMRLHEIANQLVATAPNILTHPEVARAFEQELVRLMVHCVTDDTTVPVHAPHSARLPVMRQFERVVAGSGDQTLYVAELCGMIGVPERTLRRHCLQHLGMTPHRYLWLRRMHLARRALTLAEARATTVTTVANDHGFGELGRFAVTYRQLFGEPPSVTLRRPSDSPRAALEIASVPCTP